MESFSTDSLVKGGRMQAWNEIYSSRLSKTDFTPQDNADFSAGLKLGGLGQIGMARLITAMNGISMAACGSIPSSFS